MRGRLGGSRHFACTLLWKQHFLKDTGTVDPAGVPTWSTILFLCQWKIRILPSLVHMVNLYILYVTWNVSTAFSFVCCIHCSVIWQQKQGITFQTGNHCHMQCLVVKCMNGSRTFNARRLFSVPTAAPSFH